ncbi:hypothetical protein [Mameliella sp.]|uniref:hypothetical protein n=1 Tax=Mameliella sp. TaxID=1924940 RepID=UPI003BABD615
MKQILLATGLCVGLLQPALAQTTTEARVIGPSGLPVYSVQVLGTNGITYNCRPDTEERDGQVLRYCRRVKDTMVADGDPFALAPMVLTGAVLAVFAVGSASGTD